MPGRAVGQWVWVRSWECGAGAGEKEALRQRVWGVEHGGSVPVSLATVCRVLGRGRHEYRRGEGTVGPIAGMF